MSYAYGKILNAQKLAEKATVVFTKTIEKLKDANEELRGIILSENQLIQDHEQNIIFASRQITGNDKIIDKIKEFIE